MNKAKGYLFVVSGPSGAGKSSLIKRFLNEDRNSTFSVSCTTREKRPKEIDGKTLAVSVARPREEGPRRNSNYGGGNRGGYGNNRGGGYGGGNRGGGYGGGRDRY